MSYARKYSPIVKDLLLQRVDLTHQTMIENGYGWRLSAVIFCLRGQGWKIDTILDSRRIGHYRLEAGWSPEMLESGCPSTGEVKGAEND